MIIAFDPGHSVAAYACYDPFRKEVLEYGKLKREDMRDFVLAVEQLSQTNHVALVESQYVQMTGTKATMAAIAASTIKVAKCAGMIEGIFTVNGKQVISLHPKTWQTIFTEKGKTPTGRKAIKAASRKTAEAFVGEAISSQDVCDAICMLYWWENSRIQEVEDD